jgi:hypothetical protein
MYRVIGLTAGVLVALSLGATAEQASVPAARSTSRHSASQTAPRTGGAVPGPVSVSSTSTEPPRNALSAIQGNALNATNGPLPGAIVRLRDARSGRIAANGLTDEAGLFAFRGLNPGSYVVEMMGRDGTVLAASQILNVNAGETALAIVKLPFRVLLLAGLFGHTAQSAAAVTAAAASAAVLGIAATRHTSPQ